jgi:hypothetical protein
VRLIIGLTAFHQNVQSGVIDRGIATVTEMVEMVMDMRENSYPHGIAL